MKHAKHIPTIFKVTKGYVQQSQSREKVVPQLRGLDQPDPTEDLDDVKLNTNVLFYGLA